MNQTTISTNLLGPSVAPSLKQIRKYLRTIQQRETLGHFAKAGWSPEELGEAARQVYLPAGKTYPTASSYQFLMEKGPEHAYACELLSTFRASDFVMPPFNRPVPRVYAWDAPDNPDHSEAVRDDISKMADLWRNREAQKHDQPWPTEPQPIPPALWKQLFRIRNRYHSLDDTLCVQRLRDYDPTTKSDIQKIAECLRKQRAAQAGYRLPDPNTPISTDFWSHCFNIREKHSSLEETLARLVEYR